VALVAIVAIGLHVERQIANASAYPLVSETTLGLGLRTVPTVRETPCPFFSIDATTPPDTACRGRDEPIMSGDVRAVTFVKTTDELSGKAAPGSPSPASPPPPTGSTAAPSVGTVFYTGDSYELWKYLGAGRFARLVGVDGQRLTLPSLGSWDSAANRFSGQEIVATGAHWLPDLAGLQPFNGQPRLGEVTGDGRAPVGWQVGPPDADYLVSRQVDEDGPFVRITVRRGGDAILLYRGERPPGAGTVPLTARARIRAQAKGSILFSMSEQSSTSEPAINHVVQATPDGTWRTLVLTVERSSFPGQLKVVYLGLLNAQPGDSFDVREIDFLLGVIP
jgi:hypothetical protein